MKDLKIKNFRDVSGYKNKYGETMKRNCIFRGGPLDRITPEMAAYMEEELGIRYILDYRDEQEAKLAEDVKFPNALWERIPALRVKQAEKEGFDFGAMMQGEMTAEKLDFMGDYIREGYKGMAFDNPAYHRVFELLLRNDGHIYFHCSAGKDRTGVCAFLIMMALGMDEEDGVKEYLLSNEYLHAENEALFEMLHVPEEGRKKCEVLLYVQEENLRCTIASIKEKYQDYDEFLEKEYGIDEAKREQLRAMYCEK